MNLLADEGVDFEIVRQLRADGHSVFYAAELAPGTPDDQILQQANKDGGLLITTDKDFGELVYRQGRIHAGVVLIRLAGLSATAKAAAVAEVFRARVDELAGAFSVISPGLVRIRRTH